MAANPEQCHVVVDDRYEPGLNMSSVPDGEECKVLESMKYEDSEGLLMRNFRAVVAKGTERCFKVGSTFQKNYKVAWESNKELFDSIVTKSIQNAKVDAMDEFEVVIQTEGIEESLDKLDRMLSESKMKDTDKARKAWRPSGNPTKDIQAHRLAIKHKFKKELEEQLALAENANKQLAEKVTAMRRKLKDTEDTECPLDSFDEAKFTCNKFNDKYTSKVETLINDVDLNVNQFKNIGDRR